jgi:hypothetical protein
MKKLQQFPELVYDYFLIDEGKLIRKLACGKLRPVTTFFHDQLIVTFAGQQYAACDVAWLLHYGVWPTRELVYADGDPRNLREANLLPVRQRRYRFRPAQSTFGWSHKLSTDHFTSQALCAADWFRVSTDIYRMEKRLVLTEEAQLATIRRDSYVERPRPPLPPLPRPPTKPMKLKLSERPARPSKSHIWHIASAQWVDVPPACCVADDQQVRAGHVLAGYSVFAYDAAAGKVLPVS